MSEGISWDGAFEGQLKPGEKPALLLVDPVIAYVVEDSPLKLETGQATVDAMARLLALFRDRGPPIAFTNLQYKEDGSDGGVFFRKVPALKLFAGDAPLGAFPEELTPADGEVVFTKQYPSAFFGTELDAWLADNEIDTVYVCGFSTSGCVRASVLDAMQYGYIPLTVTDACGDRSVEIQSANLHDLQAKYSEMVTVDQVAGLI